LSPEQIVRAEVKSGERRTLAIVALFVVPTMLFVMVVYFMAVGGGGGSSNDRSSPFDRCVDLQILHGSGGWAAAGECAHYKD
jgi:hypothetical protein